MKKYFERRKKSASFLSPYTVQCSVYKGDFLAVIYVRVIFLPLFPKTCAIYVKSPPPSLLAIPTTATKNSLRSYTSNTAAVNHTPPPSFSLFFDVYPPFFLPKNSAIFFKKSWRVSALLLFCFSFCAIILTQNWFWILLCLQWIGLLRYRDTYSYCK